MRHRARRLVRLGDQHGPAAHHVHAPAQRRDDDEPSRGRAQRLALERDRSDRPAGGARLHRARSASRRTAGSSWSGSRPAGETMLAEVDALSAELMRSVLGRLPGHAAPRASRTPCRRCARRSTLAVDIDAASTPGLHRRSTIRHRPSEGNDLGSSTEGTDSSWNCSRPKPTRARHRSPTTRPSA